MKADQIFSEVKRGSLYEKVAGDIALMIRQGTYRPGERIPSVRRLSRQLRVSISTVLQSYHFLEDQGIIEARPQSGFYVRVHQATSLPEPEISSPHPDPSRVSVQELTMMTIRDSVNPNLIQLGAAIPRKDLLPTEKLNRMLASIARNCRDQPYLYDVPPGCKALRIQVAQRAVAAGCHFTPEDIVTTTGCSESIYLALRAICRPGDVVAIESPAYFGILQVLESMGLRALEIPTHPRHGISLDALRFAIEHSSVRACLVISNFNNPLGSCMPDDSKMEMVNLLASREIPLIEDDASGEIFFMDRRPTVAKSYDEKGLVLLCSSFSKDLSPGYRVGWIAPGRFKAAIEWLKFTSTIATATLPQLAIAEFLSNGGYDRHMRRVRRVYARNVTEMSQAVERYFPPTTRVTRPTGGFVLWVQLPETVDSLTLYKLALNAGMTISPGYMFSATDRYRHFIRLNAAHWLDRGEWAIETLGRLIRGNF